MFQPTQDEIHSTGYVIGLDPSLTSFGVYCLPLGDEEWYGFTVQSIASDGSDTRRVLDIAEEVTHTLCDILDMGHVIRFACFEDYGPIGRTSGKIAQRAEICGILKYFFLEKLQVPIAMLTPKALKSFATGNGNASKDAMLTKAAMLGYHPDTSDEADAFFAARVARNIHQGTKTGVSFERVNP